MAKSIVSGGPWINAGEAVQAEYLYNARGQQVARRLTQTGQTIHSVHDLDGNRIAEYDYDEALQISTLIREYVWMDDRPVAVVENDTLYSIRTDHIGRPVFATNDVGVKVWQATYLQFWRGAYVERNPDGAALPRPVVPERVWSPPELDA